MPRKPPKKPISFADYGAIADDLKEAQEMLPDVIPPERSVADELLLQYTPSFTGRPARTLEEKTEIYGQLARMKARRWTHSQCAKKLAVDIRTIVNYLADPIYKDILKEITSSAREDAVLFVSDLTFDALAKMQMLMQSSASDFVQFKAAEAICRYMGLENLDTGASVDSRDAVMKFLAEAVLHQAKMAPMRVRDVGASTADGFVEAEPVLPALTILPPMDDLQEVDPFANYIVEANGRIPDSFLPDEKSPFSKF